MGTDLSIYFRVVWEKKWLVLFVAAIAIAYAVLRLQSTVPLYRATAQLKYEPTSIRVVEYGEIGRKVSPFDEMNTQIEMISSPRVAEMVIRELGLDQAPPPKRQDRADNPLKVVKRAISSAKRSVAGLLVETRELPELDEERQFDQIVDKWRNRVSVSQHRDTKLINIAVTHPDPRTAARVADEFCRQFIESLKEDRSKTYTEAHEFLDEQVQITAKQLVEAEAKLFQYERGENDLGLEVPALEEMVTAASTNLDELNQKIVATENALKLYEAEMEAVHDPEIGRDVATYILSENEEYIQTKAQLNQTELDLFALEVDGFQETSPQVETLKKQIAMLEEQLEGLYSDVPTIARGRVERARLELASLIERRDEQIQQLSPLEELMVGYKKLSREVENKQVLYDSLLTRLQQVGVSKSMGGGESEPSEFDNVTVVQQARIPHVPFSPRVMQTLMKFTLFGFVIGVLIAVGLYQLDKSVRDIKTVENTTSLPTIGVVPHMGGGMKVPFVAKKRGELTKISDMNSFSAPTEAFRLMRTALQYSTAGRSPQVLLMTSCFPREGKSTTSVNLAITYAGRGEKTLIVDADLKMPLLHQVFRVAKRPGLTDVLTGKMSHRDVIVPTGVDNLYVLPAGPQAPAPADLLESGAMDQLIAELRQEYSTVLFDSPPLFGMSDTFVLGHKVDGICVIVSLGKTREDVLQKTVASLASMNIRVLGLIYNNQKRGPVGRGGYGYDYGYGYMSGYRYGYHRREEEPEDEDEFPELANLDLNDLDNIRPKQPARGSSGSDAADTEEKPRHPRDSRHKVGAGKK